MRNREAIREYATGSLWVLPGVSAVVALVVGFVLSRIDVSPGSPLAFQGTADDARTLLSNMTISVITVIALVLGLTVVALQLSSTQFSPRLLRNFLRDRPTPDRAQHLHRDLRLFRGGPVHRGGGPSAGAPRNFRGSRSAGRSC